MAETVFATFASLARRTGAVNLGQGFPDDPPEAWVLDALRAAADGHQQYAPMAGEPALRRAVASSAGRAIGRSVDPDTEVVVTVGATEGLFASIQALVDAGDEVVIVEPWYDAYPEMVRMAGGRPVGVPMLHDGQRWRLDRAALQAAVTPATRLIIVNTPHNPTGAVYDEADLDAIVAAARACDAVVLCDEVYEHLAFVPVARLASRPGAWERTLSISSIGKSFGVTGWKVGWVTGPAELIATVRAAHQWIPFAVATPLQRAAAALLAGAEADGGRVFARARATLLARRDLLRAGLERVGFAVDVPDAGYFVVADARTLGFSDDVALAWSLPAAAGVVAIPLRTFASDAHADRVAGRLRFAFCKREDAITLGAARLLAWREGGCAPDWFERQPASR
jgi:N-succinyldiaminopimelate aminotransferase